MAAICPLPACQGRTFISDIALEQHMRSSKLQHPFCEPCDRKFVNALAFVQHLQAIHSPQYNCCGKTFRSNESLKQHQTTASSHPECSWCDERFINEEERDNVRVISALYCPRLKAFFSTRRHITGWCNVEFAETAWFDCMSSMTTTPTLINMLVVRSVSVASRIGKSYLL